MTERSADLRHPDTESKTHTTGDRAVIVSVKEPEHTEGTTGASRWGATLINVQYVKGEWMAVVKDNYDELIYVVPAKEIEQWGGELIFPGNLE